MAGSCFVPAIYYTLISGNDMPRPFVIISYTIKEREFNVKKITIAFLALLLVFSFASCKSGAPKNNGKDSLEGSLEDILENIYDTAEVSDTFKQFMKEGLQTLQVTADNAAYYLGKEDIEFAEAIASEPMISTSAYSLVLLRTKEGADIEKTKADIKKNANPMKWVCVGVKEENIIVDSIGNTIILIMSDYEAEPLHTAFLALKG